jgi:hypothetical protein
MATSGTGQFVTICASGCLHVSNDFGNNFTSIDNVDFADRIFYAVAMSTTGQYQVATTTATTGPTGTTLEQSKIFNSLNYGVTWEMNNLLNEVSDYNKFMQTIAISPNGKYIIAGGGSFVGNYFSIDYGASFAVGENVLSYEKVTTAIADDGFATSATNFSRYLTCNISINLIETTQLSQAILSTPNSISFKRDESHTMIHVSKLGVFISTDNALSLPKLINPRTDLRQVQYTKYGIVARSSTDVFISKDAVVWVSVYAGTPRTIAASYDGKFIYILLQDGTVLRRDAVITEPHTLQPGSVVVSTITPPVPFGSLNNLVLPISITIDAGLWSVSHSWGILSTDTNSNTLSQPKYAYYGLGTLTEANIISTVRSFHLTHINTVPATTDQKTNETFRDTIVIRVETRTQIYLHVRLNDNTTTATSTTLLINKPIIRAILLSSV